MDVQQLEIEAFGPEVGGPRPPSALRGALAGLLGAAAALVAIEFAALLDAAGVSVTEAIGNRFIDEFAASLKDVAISLFGRNDKVALQLGTVVVVLALGAAVGAAAKDRWPVVAGTFAAFGVLGIVVSLDDPLTSGPASVVACALATVAGAGTAIGLERRWRLPVGPHRGTASFGPTADRRTVLVNGGTLAALLLFGTLVARGARSSMRQAKTAVTTVLPKPKRKVAVPAGEFSDAELSPYITPVDDFYRIDTALVVPVVDPDGWTVKITGLVDRELSFTYDDLLARDLVEVPITIACVSNYVGGDLIGTARWTGVPLKDLLEEAGVQAGADQVVGESVDEFTAGFPLEAAMDGRDAIIAVGMNGRSLTADHGFPARLIIPGLYGYVSATKWLKEIRLTTFADEQGYWVPRGWSALGPIKTQSRIDVPGNGDTVAAGTAAIAGVAWAPHVGVAGVEFSVDDGPWQPATLAKVASVDTWVQWRGTWDAEPGEHRLRVRAADASGATQTEEEAPPAPDGATGWDEVRVDVT